MDRSWFRLEKITTHLGLAVIALIVSGMLMTGCAKGPGAGVLPPVPVNRMIVRADFLAPINDSYYYFVAFDDSGNSAVGPLPLRRPGGNGWGAGTFTKFVQYHLGQYMVFSHKVNPDNSVTDTPISRPFSYVVPNGTSELNFTLDMDQYFVPTVTQLNVNIITTDEIITDPNLNVDKTFDGLGPSGNDYITIPITANAVFDNAHAFIREFAGDCAIPAIDITDWRIEIQRG